MDKKKYSIYVGVTKLREIDEGYNFLERENPVLMQKDDPT